VSDKTLQEQITRLHRTEGRGVIERERPMPRLRERIKTDTELEYWRSIFPRTELEIVDEPEPEPVCPHCSGLGVVRVEVDIHHADFGKLFPCPEDCDRVKTDRMAQLEKRIEISQMPRVMKSWTFQRFDDFSPFERNRKMVARVAAEEFAVADGHEVYMDNVLAVAGESAMREYSYSTRNSLVFTGPMGVGKTGLAASIVNYLMEQGEACLYMRTVEMLEQAMAEKFSDNADMRLRDFIKGVDVLLLDDANVMHKTAPQQQFMEDVIRHRYNNRMATILTTNLDEGGIEREWGARMMVALRAMAHWIPMDGVELRER
jgi:DNA replication protein DnaC